MKKRVSKRFYLSSAAVGVLGSILLAFGLYGVRRSDADPLLLLGGLAVAYSAIVTLVLYYKMWDAIQDGHARTTPGRAVGFLFIPLFNLYWIFQVLWGFAKDYNAYVYRYAIRAPRVSEPLFLTAAILTLASAAPVLNVLVGIVSVLVVSQACDGINAVVATSDVKSKALVLFCVSGQFANDLVEIPEKDLFLGRDAAKVSLAFNSDEISALHARVSRDPARAQVWVEDLNSLNGTFYKQAGAGTVDAQMPWLRLLGRVALTEGARLRLATVVEFEIRRT